MGPAYYAAAADKTGRINYGKTITKAFIDGRKIITSANGKSSQEQLGKLRKLASIIEDNWEKTLAEAVFKYAGSCFKDLKAIQQGKLSAQGKYSKHWGELKGFSLSFRWVEKSRGNSFQTQPLDRRRSGYGKFKPSYGYRFIR